MSIVDNLFSNIYFDSYFVVVNSELAYATGRGIQEKGIRVQDFVTFQVHTENAGDGELVINLMREGLFILFELFFFQCLECYLTASKLLVIVSGATKFLNKMRRSSSKYKLRIGFIGVLTAQINLTCAKIHMNLEESKVIC